MSEIRKVLLCLILVIAALCPQQVDARNIDRFLSGSWYNPAQDGHGFSIEVIANGLVVIYWYTYHPDGTPLFILAVGQASGSSVTATAFYNTGMRFGEFDPSDRMESEWGTISITFHDCNSATVAYASNFIHGGQPFGSGSFPIQRLADIDQLQCQNDRRSGTFEGRVFSSLESRDFNAFALIAQTGEFAAYSSGGLAVFGSLTLSGPFLDANGTAVSLDPDNPFSGSFTSVGEMSQEYRLFTLYDVNGGDSGFADFYASPALHRRSTTLARLAGSYDVFNPTTGFEGTATIMGNGTIAGSDELGCQYNGNLAIPDTRFNLFEVTVAISSCPGFNATYEGLGSQIDWFEFHDSAAVRVLVSDGSFGFLLIGVRQ